MLEDGCIDSIRFYTFSLSQSKSSFKNNPDLVGLLNSTISTLDLLRISALRSALTNRNDTVKSKISNLLSKLVWYREQTFDSHSERIPCFAKEEELHRISPLLINPRRNCLQNRSLLLDRLVRLKGFTGARWFGYYEGIVRQGMLDMLLGIGNYKSVIGLLFVCILLDISILKINSG